MVEPYQFEPQARVIGRSLPASTSDDDSLGGGRLGDTVCSKNKLCSWHLLFCV